MATVETTKTLSVPEHLKGKFDTIIDKSGQKPEDLMKEYSEIFLSQFIQKDPQFSSDKDRAEYTMAILWTRYIYRPPVSPIDIIPIGFDGKRLSKQGKMTGNLFVLTMDAEKHISLHRVVLTGEIADAYKSVTMFAKYTVKLGRFKDSEDMIADNRAKFDNPMALKLTAQQIIDKIGIKRVEIPDAENHLSAVQKNETSGKSFVINTDWRVVRGMITRHGTFDRDDGTVGASYTVADVTTKDPKLDDDGNVVLPQIQAWVPPEMLNWADESECDFVGTLAKSKDKKTGQERVTMNAYLIIPIHAKRIEPTDT